MSRKSRSRSATASRGSRADKDENVPPWPEWTDIFISTTIWNPFDVPPAAVKKGGTAKTVKSAKPGTANKTPSRSGSMRKSFKSVGGITEENSFDDGWSRKFDNFAGEVVSKWERAQNITGVKTSLIQHPNAVHIDLLSGNKHLMENKVLKEIIECVSCLHIASLSWPFPIEFRSINFTPPAESWKPWHHVYSKRNGGLGNLGYPSYNEFGRYIVRLYFLGKWRRIEVDDFFPLDSQGNLLLPVSCSGDLWFPILTKALIRVTTACAQSNITVITALTGWIKNNVSFHGANLNEIWNVCCSHLLKNNELLPSTSDDIHCTYYGGACLNDIRHLRESKIQKVFVFARITERIYNIEEIEPFERDLFTFVYQVTQNWIRVEDYPSWKEHRWFDWAYRHNILKGKIGQIFKFIEVYSPIWIADWECKEISSSFIERDSVVSEPNNLSFYFQELEFEKFQDCINEFELYYVPSQFEHSYRTESLNSLDLGEQTRTEAKGKTPSRSEQTKQKLSLSVSSRFFETGCSLFYVLIDSPYCKRVYLDMMFYSKPDELPNGYIICEKFNWKDDTQGSPIFLNKIHGSINKIIIAGPGRHVFKIWCVLPQQYFIQIYSNTPFVLENLETLQEKLQEDSASYKLYSNQISEAFLELVKTEYSSEEHSKALKKYMESFYPTDLRQKTHLHQRLIYRIPFDKLFEESITEFILETEIMKSYESVVTFINKLRKFFLNPSFGEEILVEVEHLNPANDSYNISAVTSAKSTPKTKEKAKTAQPSNELYFDKSENNLKILKIIMSKDNSFLSLYPFCFDDETKITFHEFKGKAEIQTHHPFFVVARLILNVHSEELVSCGIYSYVNHDFCKICVYNIATMESIPIKFNKNSIWVLNRCDMGYLVLVTCFNQIVPLKSKATELPWRIRIVSSDEESLLHPCRLGSSNFCNFKPPTPQSIHETIRGYYIPNESDIITKFLISLTQNDIITIQFTVSCASAIINVLITNGQDTIVREGEGKGNLLLPAIILSLEDAYDDTNHKYYLGEVRLKFSSWDLAPEENSFVDQIKESYVPFSDISSPGKAKRRKSRVSAASAVSNFTALSTMELDETYAPTWTLTMITEQGPRDKITKLIPDTRIFDDFKSVNLTYYDMDRLKKGSELRSSFKAAISTDQTNQSEENNLQNQNTDQKIEKIDYYRNLLNQYTSY